MSRKSLSDDIINSIDILHVLQQEDSSQNRENFHNPVSKLITPEWHYSDSARIFDSIQVSWDSLEGADLIQSMSGNVDKIKIHHGFVGDEFEKSFCSWYQPYHYQPREKWGIHVRYDSWLRIAALFYLSCPSLAYRSVASIKAAFLYLFIHQLFHYIVENAASTIEILIRKPHIYTKYYTDVYSQVFNSSNCIEEGLSNRYLFGWTEECHIDRDFLKQKLLKQGPGYNNFIEYDGSNFRKENRILMSQIRFTSLNPPLYDPIEQIVDVSNVIEYSSAHNVPIWLHREAKSVFETLS
jgi:hypothetical protein